MNVVGSSPITRLYRVVTIVFTELGGNTIRVISLRKALKHERCQYEQFLQNQLG
nr:MAG: hypothetical protein EDM05_06225 [Leptolyngbya sp. IPPAS B-1204]